MLPGCLSTGKMPTLPIQVVPERFPLILECSQRLFGSDNDLSGTVNDLFGSSKGVLSVAQPPSAGALLPGRQPRVAVPPTPGA